MNDIVKSEPTNKAITNTPSPTDFLTMIAEAARDPNVDVAKMHGLLDVQERMMNRQAEIDFNIAFGALQKDLAEVRIKKSGKITVDGRERSSYAKYEDIDAVVRPLMNKHGFTIRFSSIPEGNKMIVRGTLSHEGGHSVETVTPMVTDVNPKVMNNQQAIGSASSYAQRYILKMLLNLVFEGEDDDGKKAGTTFISDDQAAEIKELIRETNTNTIAFLDIMTDAENVEQISTRDYNRVVMALRAKRKTSA